MTTFTLRTEPITEFWNREEDWFLLNEDGSFILNEDTSQIIIEEWSKINTEYTLRIIPS